MSYSQREAELERELRGARLDLQFARGQVAGLESRVTQRERRIEELAAEVRRITEHRDRLLAEKEVAWGIVLAPDKPPAKVAPIVPISRSLAETCDGLLSLVGYRHKVHGVGAEAPEFIAASEQIRSAIMAADAGPPTSLPPLNHLSTTHEGPE